MRDHLSREFMIKLLEGHGFVKHGEKWIYHNDDLDRVEEMGETMAGYLSGNATVHIIYLRSSEVESVVELKQAPMTVDEMYGMKPYEEGRDYDY